MKKRISPKSTEERKDLILNTISHMALMEHISEETIYTPGFYDKYVKNSDTFSYSTVFTSCKKTGKTAREILSNKNLQNKVIENFYALREKYQNPKSREQLSLELEEKYNLHEWNEKFLEVNIHKNDTGKKFTFQEIVSVYQRLGVDLTQTITKKITV